MVGILIGAGLFAEFFPKLNEKLLSKGYFGEMTWPELLNVNPWGIVIPVVSGVIGLLFWIENAGL